MASPTGRRDSWMPSCRSWSHVPEMLLGVFTGDRDGRINRGDFRGVFHASTELKRTCQPRGSLATRQRHPSSRRRPPSRHRRDVLGRVPSDRHAGGATARTAAGASKELTQPRLGHPPNSAAGISMCQSLSAEIFESGTTRCAPAQHRAAEEVIRAKPSTFEISTTSSTISLRTEGLLMARNEHIRLCPSSGSGSQFPGLSRI